MIIKYYTDNDLAYANRKRRRSIESYTTDLTENQKAVKLGDGATTSVITSEANLCNYVTIGDTRWYVVSYIYLNGGQIQLNLRRDVIGEFGLEGCVGKIERGYTESFLRNRKELDLNQRLINRIPLISTDNTYGNYTVDNHVNEMWGILYFSKPTELDSNGDVVDSYNYGANKGPKVLIPTYKKETMSYTYIVNDTKYTTSVGYRLPPLITFNVKMTIQRVAQSITKYFTCVWTPEYVENIGGTFINRWHILTTENIEREEEYPNSISIIINKSNSDPVNSDFETCFTYLKDYMEYACFDDVNKYTHTSVLPVVSQSIPTDDYNGAIIYHNSKYLEYTVTTENTKPANQTYNDLITDTLDWWIIRQGQQTLQYTIYNYNATDFECFFSYLNNIFVQDTYNCVELSTEDMGYLTIDITTQYVDEPFTIYAIPLYDVTITRPSYTDYSSGSPVVVPAYNKTINGFTSQQIFNSIIEYCSGANAYLVDAQIYPYCPELKNIGSSIKDYPLFNVQKTSFNRNVSVQLKPYKDIKKEYIKREYCLTSPDQSGSYKFNYYDFSNDIIEDEESELYNYDYMQFVIKTALKPMNIISSVVITPKAGCLKGITYPSDLRGCNSSGNGYECSLSTDKFQEYVRNNSNYQAIFSLQREELQKQHQVEKVNEQASIAVNTITATMMGAIGGASLADYSYLGTSAKGAGAATGAIVAGATVGSAMGAQYSANNKLREYEEYLQQQNFNLQIGTIKNIPNQVSRISSFNEIIMRDFYYVIEVYECSEAESIIVDNFIERYGYALGIIEYYDNFKKNNWFLRGTLITSNLTPILHNIAEKELRGGIYYIYE